MECKKCGGLSDVVLSRAAADTEGGRVRRRVCRRCKRRWYTLQPQEQEGPWFAFSWRGNDVLVDRARVRRWQDEQDQQKRS